MTSKVTLWAIYTYIDTKIYIYIYTFIMYINLMGLDGDISNTALVRRWNDIPSDCASNRVLSIA